MFETSDSNKDKFRRIDKSELNFMFVLDNF